MPLDERVHLEQAPVRTPRRDQFMSSEPLTTTADATDAASAEKGLLIAMLVMVLMGVSAMLFML
jgi:hypothetical protein